MVLHTLWGGRVNRPFSLALEAAWEESFGLSLESYPTNDGVYLVLPGEGGGTPGNEPVHRGNGDRLIRNQLESSGFFGARFRECAGRALLLGRRRPGQRTPCWMNRLRSRKLMDAVLGYEDFPILLEAWRTCLRDEFEMASLYRLLDEIASGEIRCTEVATATGSPFVRASAWRQVNQYMYMDDSPQAGCAPASGRTGCRRWCSRISCAPVSELPPRPPSKPGCSVWRRASPLKTARRSWTGSRKGWRSPCGMAQPAGGMERDHQLVEEDLLEEVGKKACLVDLAAVDAALVCAVETWCALRRLSSRRRAEGRLSVRRAAPPPGCRGGGG